MSEQETELLMKRIQKVSFPEDQYYREETDKNQIYLHHTVSPGNTAKGDIQYWLGTTARVATHVIITQDGTINQLFNSKYWGHHLGVTQDVFDSFNIKTSSNLKINKHSLSIELDSLGPVREDGSSVAYGPKLKAANITKYATPYRGHYCYESYTEEQIESLRLLLKFWCEKFNIPKTYNSDMWKVNESALKGVSGIWSHTSVRQDKSDIHPQPELIEMLKNL